MAPAIDPFTGTLGFTPAQDSFGTTKVTVVMNDHGGGQELSVPKTFTLKVNAVNDKPSFSLAGDATVTQDSGPISRSNWLTGIVPDPANEATQKLAAILLAVDSARLGARLMCLLLSFKSRFSSGWSFGGKQKPDAHASIKLYSQAVQRPASFSHRVSR